MKDLIKTILMEKMKFALLLIFFVVLISCDDMNNTKEHDHCYKDHLDENISRYCIDLVDSIQNIEKHIYYNKNNNISSYYYTKNNVAEGLFVEFYESGEIAETLTSKNGLLEGHEVSYHKNGQIKCIASWVKNKLEGDEICYCEDGYLLNRKFFHENRVLFEYDYNLDKINKIIPIVSIDSVVSREKPALIAFYTPYIKYIDQIQYYILFNIIDSIGFHKNYNEDKLPRPSNKVKMDREIIVNGFTFPFIGEFVFYGVVGVEDSISGKIEYLFSLPIRRVNIIE